PGKGVHVVTVNEYLARRDAVWMGQIYHFLGLRVACLVPNGAFLYDPEWKISQEDREELDADRDAKGSFLVHHEYLRPVSRREAYRADVVYGTNHEFGFDYLRDNLAHTIDAQVQRGHFYAIVDEVDSILIDEARTPLIISAPDKESSSFYKTFARVVAKLVPERDYLVDEKLRSVSITPEGIAKVERMVGIQNLYAPENMQLVHYLEESLKARALFRRDRDYVVKDGEVIIVDEFTGRLLRGRRYSGGLHQAIEAKEGVKIQEESRTLAKISIQNYFRLYQKLAGMTGTAQTSAEEFYKVYGLEVVSIPTNKPLIRRDLPDVIYKTFDAKLRAITEDVARRHRKGQPVLVGTVSIEKNEIVSSYFRRAGIPHEVLNAKNNEREGAIIAQAGKLGAVTVATNMAGRGVDIILGGNPPDPHEAEKVRALGGLHVIGTERHEARRIDDQLRGRAGRQGDPGSSQFFLSLEDDLLRIFGGDKVKRMMETLRIPEDQPIELGIVSRAVAQAQAKVEGANFDLRKHLLEYDDVLNKQRMAVYQERQKILQASQGTPLAEFLSHICMRYLEKMAREFFGPHGGELDEAQFSRLEKVFREAGIVTPTAPFPRFSEATSSREGLLAALRDLLKKRSEEIASFPALASRLLSLLDLLWMHHLEALEALSESVRLRAYGQKDPLVEYKREAHLLYQEFWLKFQEWVFYNIFRISFDNAATQPSHPAPRVATVAGGDKGKIGRNEPCPCGSGKKYKKCHGRSV
ncbi:preprotein translocase subunit SecA, partial [Candidatus Parcubacteria bacterium]